MENSTDHIKWRKMIQKTGFILCSAVLILEILCLIVYVMEDDLGNPVRYVIKNLVIPTIINYGFFLFCHFYCKSNHSDNSKNSVAILSIAIPSACATIIHYNFHQGALCMTISLMLSTIFGNKKNTLFLLLLDLVAMIIAFAFNIKDGVLSVGDALMNYALNFSLIIAFYISCRVILNVVQDNQKKTNLYIENERKLNEELKIDGLTRLYNNYAFKTYLQVVLNKGNYESLAVAMIDIDNFKKINDEFGHLKGDEILKGLSKIIKMVECDCSISTKAARYGGEEFAIIFINDSKEKIESKMMAASEQFSNYFDFAKPTFSCGIFEVKGSCTVENAINKADELLYDVKNFNKNDIKCSWNLDKKRNSRK